MFLFRKIRPFSVICSSLFIKTRYAFKSDWKQKTRSLGFSWKLINTSRRCLKLEPGHQRNFKWLLFLFLCLINSKQTRFFVRYTFVSLLNWFQTKQSSKKLVVNSFLFVCQKQKKKSFCWSDRPKTLQNGLKNQLYELLFPETKIRVSHTKPTIRLIASNENKQLTGFCFEHQKRISRI